MSEKNNGNGNGTTTAVDTTTGKRQSIKDILTSDAARRQIAMALPKCLTPERMIRVALTALGRQPKLMTCTQESLFSCLMDLAALGIPGEREYIELYCAQTRIATPDQLLADWNFYMAYNMFRITAILQGIAKRVEAGTASSAQAVASAAGARPLAQMAWSFAQKA